MEVKDKIEKIMEKEQMNSLQFASEIGIQGSTLSHILNERNKPSLDVLKKILNRFRTISSDWLILDVGSMYRTEKQSQGPTLFDSIDENVIKSSTLESKSIENADIPFTHFQQKSAQKTEIPNYSIQENHQNYIPIVESAQKSVHKIIVYYSDNTFQEFESK
jgi:transcriptional regulator with XRE-family HTH domain